MGINGMGVWIVLVGMIWWSLCFSNTHTENHVIVKRMFPGSFCAFEKIACHESNEYCESGKVCVDVKVITFEFPPSCEYVCQSNSTLTTELDTVTPNTNVTTEDPAVCSANFICKNGGNCSESYTLTGLPSCDCPPQYQGPVCDIFCDKECFNNGTCYNDTDVLVCNCPFGFAPPDCLYPVSPASPASTIEPDGKIWYIPVIVCISIVLLAVLCYIILFKLRGRSLFVTKIFHFLQPYEDDDGKLFDAFISFRSSKRDFSQSDDEIFVLRVLQPILEKEFQYKVCVHYRDFLPGNTIANNIMWAVENSRRTILILSPLYVESEWARLEYQKAQQEMLQLRHKIIPVIFEDISKTRIEDPNLRHILSSVTYIIYPKDSDAKASNKFWQMLKLALPKKKSTDIESPPIALSSPNSHEKSLPKYSSQESCLSASTELTELPGIEGNGHVSQISPTIPLEDLDKIPTSEKNEKNVKARSHGAICSTKL